MQESINLVYLWTLQMRNTLNGVGFNSLFFLNLKDINDQERTIIFASVKGTLVVCTQSSLCCVLENCVFWGGKYCTIEY